MASERLHGWVHLTVGTQKILRKKRAINSQKQRNNPGLKILLVEPK